MAPVLDAGMKNYAEVTASLTGKDHPRQRRRRSRRTWLCLFKLSEWPAYSRHPADPECGSSGDEMKDADIVVTGEGRLDHQTAMGRLL
mgnify:CR=1 FL=1